MKRNAFTLVELLVVIAIISVLAALLLPALEEALNAAYRIKCLNNQRQTYVCIANYANEWNDRLPYQAQNESWSSVAVGEFYWAPANAPIRNFLAHYVGLNMDPGQTLNAGSYLDKGNTIVHCPDWDPYRIKPSDGPIAAGYSGSSVHYGFTGFGVINLNDPAKRHYGTTRLSLVAARTKLPGYPAAPILPFAMVAELIPYGQYEDSHKGKGGNVVGGDGAGQWVPSEGWGHSGQSQEAPVQHYYTQWFFGGGFWGPSTTGGLWTMYYNAHKVLGYNW